MDHRTPRFLRRPRRLQRSQARSHPNGLARGIPGPPELIAPADFSLTFLCPMLYLCPWVTAYGVRELAPAFLFQGTQFRRSSVQNDQNRILWNQSLTKCKFCNPFLLTFIQNDGGR